MKECENFAESKTSGLVGDRDRLTNVLGTTLNKPRERPPSQTEPEGGGLL